MTWIECTVLMGECHSAARDGVAFGWCERHWRHHWHRWLSSSQPTALCSIGFFLLPDKYLYICAYYIWVICASTANRTIDELNECESRLCRPHRGTHIFRVLVYFPKKKTTPIDRSIDFAYRVISPVLAYFDDRKDQYTILYGHTTLHP